MALPNPFGSNAPLKPNFTALNATPKIQTINPGPGLPQALQPHYSNSSVTKKPFTDSKARVYSSNKNSFSTSQNYSFSCDRCDRSFKNQELLDCHISEHIPCGIDGCPFVAHPKIVEKHIQMQHETGLADQIMRLNTPEEIQKWREARKKYSLTFFLFTHVILSFLLSHHADISLPVPISRVGKLNNKKKRKEEKFFMNQRKSLVIINC